MISRKGLALATSAWVIAAAFATPAHAAGTTAGTTIQNTVSVDYKVGTVSQNQLSASDSFVVDRKVNLTVVERGFATTSVSPGQQSAVVAWDVTNTSNEALDFALAVAQLSGGAAPHGGTDSFDVTAPTLWVDNGDGTFNSASDTQVNFIDNLAADSTRTVFVVANVPLGRVTGDIAALTLTATAREGGAGSLGAALVQTTGANTAGKDTVFADDATGGQTAGDAAAFARDDYTVSAASLTVRKLSTIHWDPVNLYSNPKMIPGSIVRYCISVENAAGSATATNVALSDTLPSTLTFVSSNSEDSTALPMKINGGLTAPGGACDPATGTNGGTNSGQSVSATLADVAAGEAKTPLFYAKVNSARTGCAGRQRCGLPTPGGSHGAGCATGAPRRSSGSPPRSRCVRPRSARRRWTGIG